MVGFYQLLATTLVMILCIPMNIGHALGGHGETKILCIESEREALLNFKQGLEDASNFLSSWARGTDCCKWKGVECNRTTGHVTSLFISNGVLQGEINSALLDLPYLTYLDLSSNVFNQSQLPAFLGSLNNLRHLNLSNGNLEGTIPDCLRNLSRLKSLDLGHNYNLRASNLEWLYSLSSLKVLDLTSVDLSNIADGWVLAVNVLPSLVELHLEGCRLDYVPPSLSPVNCVSLVTLDLSSNFFNTSAILDWVFQCCHNLRHLDLSNNELKGEIPSLTILSNNSLTGPTLGENQLGIKSSMRELRLSHNNLNGTLKGSLVQGLSQLIVLDVSHNDLEGVITDVDLDNFDSLQVLDLSGNHFIFNITREWIPPFQLETISLSYCNLGPQFPKWIQTQKNFSYIDISYANVSDVVPDWFWDLPIKVEFVDLSYNDLKGHVPDLSSKGKLQGFDLSNNNFSCPLPKFPPYIAELNLARNSFFGPIIDMCYMNISSLLLLDLSSNKFSGNLPNCLMTNGTNLVVLRLADNHFVGSIPDTFGECKYLLVLSLNNNDFSGNLPLSMRNCSSLVLLDVGNNKLSGTIPSWIEDMESLEALILSSNAFDGNIPITLCNIEPLRILDFSFNHLSGPIPGCIFVAMATEVLNGHLGDIGYEGMAFTIGIDYAERLAWKGRNLTTFGSRAFDFLKVLDLSSNFLTGDIPEKITAYVGLKSLNLSRNQIEGAIPSNIGNMESLEALDLSWNKLTGIIPISIINMDQLGVLDVSHNNLTGPIPLGRHFDTLDSSSFVGNPNLCGRPLNKSCSISDSFQDPYDEEKGDKRDGLEFPSFYISMGIGFITGFMGILGPLLLSRGWRQVYFGFLSSTYDKLYVMVAVTMAKRGKILQSSN